MSTNHIAAAVEPLRAASMDRAEEYARNMIEAAYADLAANDWDLQKAAPYPNSMMNRRDYSMKKARHNFLASVTKSTLQFCRSWNGPDPREADEAAAARFIKEARDDASAQFDAYVAKMVAKIGDVDSAEIRAYGVWQYSILTVSKDGAVERWKTQQIVNTSPLGKPFNQWPTRQIKAA